MSADPGVPTSRRPRRGRRRACLLLAAALAVGGCTGGAGRTGAPGPGDASAETAAADGAPEGRAPAAERRRYAREAGEVCRRVRRGAGDRRAAVRGGQRRWDGFVGEVADAAGTLAGGLEDVPRPEADDDRLRDGLVRAAAEYGEAVATWLEEQDSGSRSPADPRTVADVFDAKRALDGHARRYGVGACVDVPLFAPLAPARTGDGAPGWDRYRSWVEDACVRTDGLEPGGGHATRTGPVPVAEMQEFWAVRAAVVASVPAPADGQDTRRVAERLVPALTARADAAYRYLAVRDGWESLPDGTRLRTLLTAVESSDSRVRVVLDRLGMEACTGQQTDAQV